MLRDSIERILREYKDAKTQSLTDHPLAQLITKELPEYLSRISGSPSRYKVQGGAGKGNWAGCPWISVFDIVITESAQSGYYPVYLFREDMTGVYHSLNQGVTDIRERYKDTPKKVLEIQAKDFRAQLGALPATFPESSIDLTLSPTNLASYYEPGNICARFYRPDALPSEAELLTELKEILGIYRTLVENERLESEEADLGPGKMVEDLRKFRMHKRFEGRPKLKTQAKRIHGYTCQACGFNFQNAYGIIGRDPGRAHQEP